MSLLQLLIILRARYKVVLLYIFGVVALAVLLCLVLPNRYTAETTVVVDMSVPDPVAGVVLRGQPMVCYADPDRHHQE
jgi:succinoglycan biosynthesis transport protein ExoP